MPELLGIRMTDLQRSLKFYKDLFGREEVDGGDNSRFGVGVFVPLPGMKLELNWYPEGSKYDTLHLAFCVDSIKPEGIVEARHDRILPMVP